MTQFYIRTDIHRKMVYVESRYEIYTDCRQNQMLSTSVNTLRIHIGLCVILCSLNLQIIPRYDYCL